MALADVNQMSGVAGLGQQKYSDESLRYFSPVDMVEPIIPSGIATHLHDDPNY